MSVGAPSSRDPHKDKKLINEIGVLAKSTNAVPEREGVGKQTADALGHILDSQIVVSKNSATKKQFEDLRKLLEVWKEKMNTGPLSILNNEAVTVLEKDIALLDEYIHLLEDIGNPKAEFVLPENGNMNISTIICNENPGYTTLRKMDAKSFWRGGKKVTVTELGDKSGVTVTRRDPTTQTVIVRFDDRMQNITVEPMSALTDSFSFSVTTRYQREHPRTGGLDVTRKIVWKPGIQQTQTATPNVQQLTQTLQGPREFVEVAGTRMPHQGFGCFELKDAEKDIVSAVRNGAKQIDLATGYTDMQTGLPVDQIVKKLIDAGHLNGVYITSKITPNSLPHPVSAAEAQRVVAEHIANCGGKIDTLHTHMIKPDYTAEDVKHILDAIKNEIDAGRVQTMGMSNCSLPQLQWAIAQGYPIKVIQVEGSPYYHDKALLDFCKQNNIIVQVYAPFGGDVNHPTKWLDTNKAKPVNNPLIRDIAQRLGKTPHQIILRRLIQKGLVPLAQSTDPRHQQENNDVYNRDLSDSDMQTIDGLNNGADGSVYTKLYLDEGVFTHDVPGGTGGGAGNGSQGNARFVFEDIQQGLELKASIADVQALYQERAEHEAEEQLRKEYEAMPRSLFSLKTWKPAAVWNRFRTFWMRGNRKEDLVSEYMERYKREHKDLRNPEMIAAADRIEREFATGWDNDVTSGLGGTLWNHDEVDVLCRSFVMNNTMTEEEFERQFRDLVTRHPEIRDALGGNTDYVAGNIVLKLREKKAYFRMLSEFSALAGGYTANPNPIAYRTHARTIAERYIKETRNALNANVKNLLDVPIDAAETERWLKHEQRKLVIESNTMKIKLDVLLGGKSAYAVEDEHDDEGINKQNWMSRLGNWMDRRPGLAIGLGIGGGLTVGVLGGGLIGSLAIPTVCALKMIGKKAGHYLKEHTGSEKKMVRGLDAEHARLENLRAIMNDPSAGWFTQYRARRQYELYGETSHKDFVHESRQTITELENALVTGEQLDHRIANALARLDYYHQSGHNFFAQQDDKQMEQVMNDLQALTLSGIEASRRAGETSEQARERIVSSLNYTNTYTEIDDALRQKTADFQKKRRNLALKYGAACFVTSLGLRLGFNKLFTDTWLDNATHVITEERVTEQATQKLHQQIIDGFALDAADVAKLESMFAGGQNANSPEYFWDMLQEIKTNKGGMSVADFTDMKNNFMESYALAMQEDGYIEILKNAEHVVLDSSDPVYAKVDAYLQSKGIWSVGDGQNVLKHIQELGGSDSSTYLQSMSQEEQRKTAEYLYMFLSKPQSTGIHGLGGTYPTGGLLEASFYEEMMKNTEWIERVVKKDPTFIDYLRRVASSVGILTFANTYMENIKHTPRTQTGGTGTPVSPVTPRGFDIVTDTRKAPIEGSMAEWLRNNPL